jgi:hypothetical protein
MSKAITLIDVLSLKKFSLGGNRFLVPEDTCKNGRFWLVGMAPAPVRGVPRTQQNYPSFVLNLALAGFFAKLKGDAF